MALGAALASPALLISDLGRPARFANMLRVVRPTSPMNMGAWLLSAYGPSAGAAALLDTVGALPGLAAVADGSAAVLGSLVTTYTGVLLADTAVPVWHEARRDLPFVFAASAATSAGAAGTLFTRPGEAAPARRLALAGFLAEQAALLRMERRLGPLAMPYKEAAGRYHRAARWLGLAGGITLAAAGGGEGRGRRRRRRSRATVAGSALLLASTAATRFAIFKAGFQSAEDPEATIVPQRARLAS